VRRLCALALAGTPDGSLLPLVDLLNHDHAGANAEWEGAADGGGQLRTKRAVVAGADLIISYGQVGLGRIIALHYRSITL
jgi:hypothetical protein